MIAEYLNDVVYKGSFSFAFIDSKTTVEYKIRAKHEESAIELFKENFFPLKGRDQFLIKFFKEHSNYNCQYSGRKVDRKEMY